MRTDTDQDSYTAGEEEQNAGVPTESYIQRRARELREARENKNPTPKEETEEPEPTPKKPDKEIEEEAPEPDEEAEEDSEEGEEEKNDSFDLSQIDLNALDADSAEELGRQLKSFLGENAPAFAKGYGHGAKKEIDEARIKLREAKEERDKLAKSLEGLAPDSNKFSDVKDEAELDKMEADLVGLYDTYSRKAMRGEWEENNEGDEGIWDGNKFYTKEQMLEFLDLWKGDLREIPKQRTHLLKTKESRKQRDKVAKTLKDSYDWFGNEDSEESKAYSSLIKDPSVVGALRMFPNLEPVLMEAFAAKVSAPSKRNVRLPLKSRQTPSSGGNGAAGSSKIKDKALAEAEQRVSEGRFSKKDWVKQRSERYKNFFNKT